MIRYIKSASILLMLVLAGIPAIAQETPDRLAPLYRHSLLVSDLEQSLTLYRDVLGLTLGRVTDTPADSYSYRFFNIEPGAMRRFAYLSGEAPHKNILGLGEVPDVELGLDSGPRASAYVQTVANVEEVLEQVKAMGLKTLEPVEFMSREAGRPGIEFGIIDFDGHLILVYGLLADRDEL